jgi:soluble lytic murein transglycosylase-like protein
VREWVALAGAFVVGLVAVLVARRGDASVAAPGAAWPPFDGLALDVGSAAAVAGESVQRDAVAAPQSVIPRVDEMAKRWELPAAGARYADLIDQAAAQHGVPPDLLGRLLYQESRFRPEIIDGRVRSPAGALGIAQFMPATARERGVDPLRPESAIPGAAKYLRELRDRFGGWDVALAAYNWGQGNVARKGLDSMPAETRAYLAQILGDVGPV